MAYKLIVCVFMILLCSFSGSKHPFYLSVTDCKYLADQKTIQVSTKLFTNDIEDALKKITKNSVDVLNPKQKSEADSLLFRYIKSHLKFTVNNAACQFTYIGYEEEEGSVWTFLEIKQIVKPKTIVVENKLLYDFLPQQTNIVHIEINEVKKSQKLNNPEDKVEFVF